MVTLSANRYIDLLDTDGMPKGLALEAGFESAVSFIILESLRGEKRMLPV
jgi:hypothetical protein